MAEKIVSPGVFTNEKDLSYLAQGIGEIGAAIIGPFRQGTAFVPTIVKSPSEFEEIFGTPDGTYYTEYAVQSYLKEAGVVTVVRVAGLEGYSDQGVFGISSVSGSDTTLISVLHNTSVALQGVADDTIVTDNTAGVFTLTGTKFVAPVQASIYPSSVSDISDVFGTSPQGVKNMYSYVYFEHTADGQSTDSTIEKTVLPTQEFDYEASVARTPWITSQTISGETFDLFKVHTIGHGQPYNTKYKVSISNVKPAGSDPTTEYSTFNLSVRRFDDVDRKKVVLESYNNLTLDPNSPNYIARRIGDRHYIVSDNGKIEDIGDYGNTSKYIRVEVKPEGTFPISSMPYGHRAYLSPVNVDLGTVVPPPTYTSISTTNTGIVFPYYSGIDIETIGVKIDNTQYLKPIPSGSLPVGDDFSLDDYDVPVIGSKTADVVPRQFTIVFQGGFDGMNPVVKINKGVDITDENSQGFDLSDDTTSGSIAYFRALNTLLDATSWDINLVATPGIIRFHHQHISDRVIDMVEGREDAFYIADFVGINGTIETIVEEALEVDSNYTATYYPWVKMSDPNTGRVVAVPPSTLMPATYASNDRLAAEWFAPAGLNRGGITGAVSVMNRLTHSDRDTLYENKVNPIASFPGQGIVAYGQKTLQNKASALDRVNVRRLLITVKKYIASTSRFLVFEQNTSVTRNRFLNTVNPYLEAIQQRQGLYAFNVVMDESNNPADVIDRNLLIGQIFLQPTRTAEFIVIDFNILPTGASFSA